MSGLAQFLSQFTPLIAGQAGCSLVVTIALVSNPMQASLARHN
jgi:hypothetical protein